MQAFPRSALAALVVLSAMSSPVLAQQTRAAPVDIPFQEFTLQNGLRVIVHTDRKAPIVAVNVWYHVGANEPRGRSGFAHLFEHLMFQRPDAPRPQLIATRFAPLRPAPGCRFGEVVSFHSSASRRSRSARSSVGCAMYPQLSATSSAPSTSRALPCAIL